MPYEILEDEAPAKAAGGYEILDADPAEAPGTLEGIANSFERGNLAGQRAIEALQFKDDKPTMRQGRRAFTSAMEDPRYSYGLLENPAKTESLLGPAARVDRMTGPARESNIATAGNIADLSRRIEAVPQSAAMQEWSKADNSNWWQVFARNPVEITANIFAESLPQASTGMAAGIAGGLAGGPVGAAAGAGTGSFVVEASNAFLEGAAKSGVNLQDPEQVRAFFADETKVKEARQFALQRGFPVALFDALTAGVAGKFLKPMLGRGVGRVAAASGAEAGVQMAGGAAGEAAAQVASGQELNAKDIFAEAVGELVTTPGEVVTNLRTELKGFDVIEDVPASGTTAISEAKPATDLQPKAPPADTSADAMAELQAVLRGEAPGSQRLKGALPKVQPDKTAGVASEPVVVEKRVEVPAALTEEQRAAIEFQKRTDEAVARELANPDKNYEGMGRLELELLEGMGDARATAALRRMRARATEKKFLESLKPPEAKSREEYAALTEEERPDSLRTVVDATDRVAAPPLQAAIDAMKAGKAARQVVSEWGGGRGEHDALIDILEQINVAREEKALSELGALRKAYLKAFTESARPNVDTALKHLASARDTQGFAPAGGVPEDAGTLYRRLFDEATGQRSEKPTAQALELYFLDTVTSKEGRTKQQRGADPVALDTLHVGDKFRLKGVEMTVTAIDPDTDAVTFRAADAEQFGTSQTLTPSMANEIYPDFGSFRKSKPISESLNWPETEAPKLKDGAEPAALTSESKPEPQSSVNSTTDVQPSKDAVESALDKLKIETPPGSLQAFGLIPEIWNGLIETVRLAYRGGKTIAAAIEDGLAWLKATHGEQQFDEAAVRAELQNIVEGEPADKPAGLRAQLNNLQAEMQAIEARGEEIPQAMLDQYKDLADTLGDEIRAGRAPSGAGRVKVDEGLEQNVQGPMPNAQGTSGRRSIPQWKGEERLPGGRLKDLFTGLKAWRERAGNWLARRGARETVTMNRDVADNRANQAANAASLRVRLILNRAFDTAPGQVRVKHDIREAALTFVVEADGNRSALSIFYDVISASEHADTKAGRQALAALEYAEAHWDKLQPAAAEYKTLTETEREAELNEGVNSHEWKGGYVKHSWDRESPGTGADPTTPAAAGTPFRKPRSVATYAEGIAQGRKPTTLNALELLADRVASGQRKLNELSWVHGLRNMIDPVTDMPVVQDVIKKPRKPVNLPAEGSAAAQAMEAAGETYKPDWVTIAPEGYSVWRMGELEVAVQENFVGLLNKLTAASFFKGAAVKKVFGFIKSSLLMFDTFHLGRMVAWRQMFGLGGGYRKGQTLLDFSTADIREMAARGEIPESWADGLIENKRRLDLALRTGFNVGNVLDNAWGDALHNLPVVGTFNHWLFGQYQRGAMAEAWLIEFERMSKAMPKATEAQVARRVSKDLNARFGNLNRQGLFKSRTVQDLVRFVFLAPQWNESLIRAELGAIGQTLKAPLESVQQRRLVVGTLMKATGAMALGTFLANQILNYAFRGKPTWENEEEGWDKKISAWIPDAVSGGPGFFLNPLALPMEYTHLIEGNLHRSGGDLSEALRRVAVSRLHAAARPAEMFLTRKDALGAKLRDGEVLPAMARALIPVPIGAVSPATAAKQLITGEPSERFPGQYQKQMMASVGMKTDQAPTAEQRIRNLAREFNREKGIVPSAEFFTGDFDDLNKALRIGNKTEARKALDELLTKKTARQVYEHYKRTAAAPFTGQAAREKEFWRGLTEEQRSQYLKAREARRQTALKAAEMLKAAAKPTP